MGTKVLDCAISGNPHWCGIAKDDTEEDCLSKSSFDAQGNYHYKYPNFSQSPRSQQMTRLLQLHPICQPMWMMTCLLSQKTKTYMCWINLTESNGRPLNFCEASTLRPNTIKCASHMNMTCVNQTKDLTLQAMLLRSLRLTKKPL